jgi:hypothetical protein
MGYSGVWWDTVTGVSGNETGAAVLVGKARGHGTCMVNDHDCEDMDPSPRSTTTSPSFDSLNTKIQATALETTKLAFALLS